MPRSSSVGPLRLPTLGRSIAACGSSSQSSTATIALRDVVDDRRPARRADDQVDAPRGVVDDRRRHRRARPLARLDRVRDRRAVPRRREREIGELVVEQEAARVIIRAPNASSIVVVIATALPSRVDDRQVRRRRPLVASSATARATFRAAGAGGSPRRTAEARGRRIRRERSRR